MEIATQNIILRPWNISDADSLYEYAKNPRVGAMDGWPPHLNVQNSRDVIVQNLMKEDYYALCLKKDNIAIGCVGLMEKAESTFDLDDNEAELGFWIGYPFWNQGLTTEAALAMIEFARDFKSINTLWAGHYVGNIGAKKILEKCGFEYQFTELRSYVKLMCEYRACDKYKLELQISS